MDNTADIILREYESRFEDYGRLEACALDVIQEMLDTGSAGRVMITHRVKSADSMRGKLRRKAGKYRSIDEITDIVGFRVLVFFADQVDVVASLISQNLIVDEANSIDKRKLKDPSAFGYVSLHYVCQLPEGNGCPEDLCSMKFEIQIRTMLQHTWAEIEHDLGYKSELAVPYEVRRDFARVASLLEIADGYFLNIKGRLVEYELDVRKKVRSGEADDLPLNMVTLEEYIRSDGSITSLNNEIASISGAVLAYVSPEANLPLLKFLGIGTIGELKAFVESYRKHAVDLAAMTLKDSEIDELISTVGIYYLCRAKLIFDDYPEEEIFQFCLLIDHDPDRAMRKVRHIMRQKAAQ
ncbi:ppGpp synthetase catalytic domain-containing protein (RelA/SpoT-type nucleotidyltranferase) [Ruminococcaceae bacterium YRB3002]|nr:ppGpp synthetase catalytic domain-containing protein (RelA/SpoT-type nucleotidyltranferase) [Ruminococcaceae bacterium YRB3002]